MRGYAPYSAKKDAGAMPMARRLLKKRSYMPRMKGLRWHIDQPATWGFTKNTDSSMLAMVFAQGAKETGFMNLNNEPTN